MAGGLELKLEGHIPSQSGELLIIDPCYLVDFDFSPLEQLETESMEKFRVLLKEEHDEKVAYLEAIDKLVSIKKPTQKQLRQLSRKLTTANETYKAKLREIEEKRARLRREPNYLSPPYIGQMDRSVLLCNPIGDGNYPVIRTAQRIKIIFNYPLRDGGGSLEVEKERLRGRLLGFSNVDSGKQVIVDPIHVKIEEDIKPDLYCRIRLEKGVYSCTFVQNNDALSMRRNSGV